jgi:hypothetical protein
MEAGFPVEKGCVEIGASVSPARIKQPLEPKGLLSCQSAALR